jgi:hypothetical protein
MNPLHGSMPEQTGAKPAGKPSNRSFGAVFTAFFIVVGVWPLLRAEPLRHWALATAGAVLAATLLAPGLLTLPNRLWTRFGELLHRVVSPLVLAVMFYLVIAPIGLLMRAVGKDPLRLRIDRNADSYWIRRDPPGPSPDSMKNQF